MQLIISEYVITGEKILLLRYKGDLVIMLMIVFNWSFIFYVQI